MGILSRARPVPSGEAWDTFWLVVFTKNPVLRGLVSDRDTDGPCDAPRRHRTLLGIFLLFEASLYSCTDESLSPQPHPGPSCARSL